MSADAIANRQIRLIEENLYPQSEYEFETLLDAFSALQAVDFRLLKDPLTLLKKLIRLVNDRLDNGYAQTLNTLILKLKEVLYYQMYYDVILQDMTLFYQDKNYTYQDLLLRDLSISNKEGAFTKYIQTCDTSHRAFIENYLSQQVKELRKYNSSEAADIFERALLFVQLI